MTDAGMKELAPFRNLRSLNLYSSKVTDTGLKELASFRHLEELKLRFTPVTDAGIKAPVRPRIRDDIWVKLWDNLSFNPSRRSPIQH